MMHNANKGFTLVEVMIVVAILSILAVIAYPAYQEQMLRTGRSDGMTALSVNASALERCRSRLGSYNHAQCQIAADLLVGVPSEKGKYVIIGAINANTFSLNADPQGGQTSDTKCQKLTLDQRGREGIDGGTETAEYCWKK